MSPYLGQGGMLDCEMRLLVCLLVFSASHSGVGVGGSDCNLLNPTPGSTPEDDYDHI